MDRADLLVVSGDDDDPFGIFGGEASDAFGDDVTNNRLSIAYREGLKGLVYVASAKSSGDYSRSSQKINEGRCF